MRESMKDLKIVDVPAAIRAGNFLNTSYYHYCSGSFAWSYISHIHTHT